MALPATINAAQLTGTVVADLLELRTVLGRLRERFRWTSSVALADIEGLGIDPVTAQSILTAVADANAFAQLYDTGMPPAAYPQPPTAYVYGASQRALIGPQG